MTARELRTLRHYAAELALLRAKKERPLPATIHAGANAECIKRDGIRCCEFGADR